MKLSSKRSATTAAAAASVVASPRSTATKVVTLSRSEKTHTTKTNNSNNNKSPSQTSQSQSGSYQRKRTVTRTTNTTTTNHLAKKVTALRKFASGVVRPSVDATSNHHLNNNNHNLNHHKHSCSRSQSSNSATIAATNKHQFQLSADAMSENSEPVHDFFPKDYEPETGDFLTFLCLRQPPSASDEHDNDYYNGTDSYDSTNNAILSPSQTKAMRWIQTLRINCVNELKSKKSMNLYTEYTVFPSIFSKKKR